jgi:O-antigen ligase
MLIGPGLIPSAQLPFGICLSAMKPMRYFLCLAVGATLPAAWIMLFALVATGLVFLVLRPRFQYVLFWIFILVAWFPEFSQTEDVYSAEDVQTIYNYRPIASITASAFDYMFAAIVAVWIFKYVLPNPRKLLDAPLAKYMLALLGLWIFNLLHGLLRGNETYYALREFRCQAYFVLTFLIIVTVCKELGDVQKFIKLSLVLATFVGSYGVLRYFLGIGKEFMDHLIVFYDIADSIVLYIAILLIASFAIEGTVIKGKAFLTTVLTFPMIFTFLFSYRRGAWVGCFAGLLFLIFLYPERPRLRRLMLRRVLVPAVAMILLIAAVPAVRSAGLDFVMTRVYSIFDVSEDSSNVFRIMDALNALTSFSHHPVLGVGAGGRYDLEFTSERVLMSFMEEVNRTSHNGYLFILFKTGITGFLIYVAVYIKFLRQWFEVRTRSASPTERTAFMAVGAIVVAILVNNITETVSDLLRPSLLLAFVMGWGAILVHHLKSRPLALYHLRGNIADSSAIFRSDPQRTWKTERT